MIGSTNAETDPAATRHRLWEFGATTALILAVGCVAAGFAHVEYLNRRLRQALERQDTRAALSLLHRGASVHVRVPVSDQGVLDTAALTGDGVLLEEALRRGVPPDKPGIHGLSPLGCAVIGEEPEIVRRLLQVGADPMQRDPSGHTVRWIAERQALVRADGRVEKILQLLRSRPGRYSSVARFR